VNGPTWNGAAARVLTWWLEDAREARRAGSLRAPPWGHGAGKPTGPSPITGTRGPSWDRALVDELAPLVDLVEAARLLTRPRDLVDECVAVTLREPTWLGEAG
jgi:hypothetical protein